MSGHIEKRAKGGWTIVFEKGKNPISGKRERIYKSIKGSKREAERELHAMMQLLQINRTIH
ncbi:MAG: hypothetical protein ABRQ23_00695 [Syntrophomonadaceae bacterium]